MSPCWARTDSIITVINIKLQFLITIQILMLASRIWAHFLVPCHQNLLPWNVFILLLGLLLSQRNRHFPLEIVVVFSELSLSSRNHHSSLGIIVPLVVLFFFWNCRFSFGIVGFLSELSFFFRNCHSFGIVVLLSELLFSFRKRHSSFGKCLFFS